MAQGGYPGGGNGHGGNQFWAAGGGGGYSMVQRYGSSGLETVCVASGGGGGGGRDGQPGGCLDGELPGTKIDQLNGRMGTASAGGKPGDCGEGILADFDAESGQTWQGGCGASFGGGGGGGFFGGGGGGISPGIVGAGGGGSCYVNLETCADVVVMQGEGREPGGVNDRTPPPATGMHELDKVGGPVGLGGEADTHACAPGNHGGVRIYKPGFYNDNDRGKSPSFLTAQPGAFLKPSPEP